MTSIFLSHNTKDKRFARRLSTDLQHMGIRVWLDEAEMLPGDSLAHRIAEAIVEADYLGVILSPNSVKSEWVRKEVEIAIDEEIKGKQLKVIPILYRPCPVPPILSNKMWADFSKQRSYKKSLSLLLRRLAGDLMRSYSNDLKQFGQANADEDFVWTPKAFRLGLRWGLVQDDGELSETYIYHLCNEAHELVTSQFEVFLKEDLVPLHVHAAGKAKSAKQVDLDDFVYFISEVTGRPLTKYLVEIGHRARILTYDDKNSTFRPDQGLMHEFFEMAENLIADGEIHNGDEVVRWVVQSLFELINARLLLNLPIKKNHGHLLALYIHRVYEFSKMVKKVLNEFSKSSEAVE